VKVRFLANADLNQAIASGVVRREPAIDFLTAHAARLRMMKDPEVLAPAAEQQRVLVSHDVGTMPAHFRAFTNAGKRSAGVFLIPQNLDVGNAIEKLLLIWISSDYCEWENRLEWLPLEGGFVVRPEAAIEVPLRSPHQEIYFRLALCFRIKQHRLRKLGD
jgi:hypothetical protein